MARPRSNAGFTLVELAVVLTVIALVLGFVLTQTGLLKTGNAIHVTSVIQDLVKATGEFRNRYKFLPGDFPAEASDLADVAAACKGNGNGVVDSAEEGCVPDHLFRANLIRAPVLSTRLGPVRIVSRTDGQDVGHPLSVRNVIELCMIPGELDGDGKMIWGGVAQDVDARIDDGSATAGIVRWTVTVVGAWCPMGGPNPVPLMSVALR